MTDIFAGLLDLPDVAGAMSTARAEVDQALRHRALRRSGGPVAAEVGLRSATASAALEGHEHDLASVRGGTVTDPVVQGALRVSAALDGLASRWTQTPRGVLARLHVLAARGVIAQDELGRPANDPQVGARLGALCELLGAATEAPALIRAAVVHAELFTMGAFAGPNGVVARAAARLTMISAGLDPRGLIAPEVGHLDRRPEYQGSLNAYATGTRDGVRSWLRHYAIAVELGARALAEWADSVSTRG